MTETKLSIHSFAGLAFSQTIQTFQIVEWLYPFNIILTTNTRENHTPIITMMPRGPGRFRPWKSWKISVFYVKSGQSNGLGTSSSSWLPELMRLANWSCTSLGLRGSGALDFFGKYFNGFQWIYWIIVENNRFQSIKLFERKNAVVGWLGWPYVFKKKKNQNGANYARNSFYIARY